MMNQNKFVPQLVGIDGEVYATGKGHGDETFLVKLSNQVDTTINNSIQNLTPLELASNLIDISDGNNLKASLIGNITIAGVTGSTTPQTVTYILTQHASVSSDVTFPNGDIVPAWGLGQTRAFQFYFDGAQLVSRYQSDFSVDGGSAASNYSETQVMDGGGA